MPESTGRKAIPFWTRSCRRWSETPSWDGAGPVSYTHLDVYKRQNVAMPVQASSVKVAPGQNETNPYPVSDAPFKPGSPVAFVRRMWPHAQEAARRLGVAPEVLIAQAAHETAWGRSVPVSYTHLDVYKRQIMNSTP